MQKIICLIATMIKVALLGVICCATNGCAKCTISEAAFYGRYELSTSDGKEYLQIFSDGTYSQKFDPSPGGPSLLRKGFWKYRPDKDRLELHNYMSIDKRISNGNLAEIVKQKLDAMLLFHCKGGNIVDLCFDEDYQVFQKVSD